MLCVPPIPPERCIALRRLPADEPQFSWLLRLMELAVSARSCLRENSFRMPPLSPIKVKHTAEVVGGAEGSQGQQVLLELSPEEELALYSRGRAKVRGGGTLLTQAGRVGGWVLTDNIWLSNW